MMYAFISPRKALGTKFCLFSNDMGVLHQYRGYFSQMYFFDKTIEKMLVPSSHGVGAWVYDDTSVARHKIILGRLFTELYSEAEKA